MYDVHARAEERYSVSAGQKEGSTCMIPAAGCFVLMLVPGGLKDGAWKSALPFVEDQAESLRKVCWRVWPRALPARLGERDRSISFRVFGKGVTLPMERA